MSYIGEQLRELRGEVARINQKLQKQRLPGKVVERDKAKGVRLDLGQDPDTGAMIKSDWHRVQGLSAGGVKISVLPSVGEQVYLESPSGVIGADSLVTFGAFDDDHQRPDHDIDAALINCGNASIQIKNGEIRMIVGDGGFVLTDEKLQMLGKFVAKNGNTPVDPTKNPDHLV